ncbi:DUF6414 family protein [Natronorarus salvus]|uniref:DUF6414 family protein n=1 Tax=Natronorarus salvus TaxID=3117733 RepID=UPI002F260E71
MTSRGDTIRDYIYLDEVTVDGWYASLHGMVPNTIEEHERTDIQGDATAGAGVDVALPFLEMLGRLNIESDLSGALTAERMSDTAGRVIDQGLHTLLEQDLDEQEKIKPMNQDLELGDIVRVTGEGQIDPLYRTILALSRLITVEQLESLDEQCGSEDDHDAVSTDGFTGRPHAQERWDQLQSGASENALGQGSENVWSDIFNPETNPIISGIQQQQQQKKNQQLQKLLEVVYGEDICLILELVEEENEGSDGTYTQCGMLLNLDKLRVEKTDLLRPKRYTALGRVVETHKDEDSNWDYVEFLRVAETVFSESEMEQLRNSFENMLEDMNGSDNISVDDNTFSANEPLVVIRPVAVYW